jgi:hypothetical protein
MKPYRRLLSALALLLTGCSKAVEPTNMPETNIVSVNVHGLNYTAEPFRYVLHDPMNLSSGAAEHIGPFSGGGITCCYVLPKRWTPGIRVNVQATHWLPKTDRGDLPKVEKTYVVEVPAYPEGAGDLWVVRTPESAIELVITNIEPDRPQWPGRIKGWPEPSLAYQRKRWELYKELAEADVRLYRKSLDHLQAYPEAHLKNGWEFEKEHGHDALKKFYGPADPAYAEYKRSSYVEGLRRSEAELEHLMSEKP